VPPCERAREGGAGGGGKGGGVEEQTVHRESATTNNIVARRSRSLSHCTAAMQEVGELPLYSLGLRPTPLLYRIGPVSQNSLEKREREGGGGIELV